MKECVLPSDQTGSLAGRWKVTPVPIAFKTGQGGFEADEIADIVAAATAWNEFFEASLGVKVLDFGDAANPTTSTQAKPSAVCAQGIVQGGQFTGQVVIYKQGAWSYAPDAIAVTTFCPVAASPLPSFFMGIMEVNFQNFFVAGKKLPDLKSIFVHEFGHLLGLDHSCDTRGKAGMPNCNDGALPAEYLDAVMFPVILFDQNGLGEERTDLNENDQGRANCLYKDLVGQ